MAAWAALWSCQAARHAAGPHTGLALTHDFPPPVAAAPPRQVHSRHGEGRKLGATIRQVLEGRVGDVAASPEVVHALQVG
jgi:hypothetical protein